MGTKKYEISIWAKESYGDFQYHVVERTNWLLPALYYLFIYSRPGNCVMIEKRIK